MIICGNAEEVEELQLKIKTGLLAIHEATVQLKQSLYGIKSKWQDEGYSEIESCIMQVMQLMDSYMDDFGLLHSLLEKYKSILRDKERNLSRNSFVQTARLSTEKSLFDLYRKNGIEENKCSNTSIFKNGITNIDSILQGYKEELMARGVFDGVAMEVVLNHYRHQYQAALVGEINGQDTVKPIVPDFDVLAENMKKNGKDHYINSLSPRKLSQTKYGFQDIIFNGQRMNVYDDPIGTGSLLIQNQGNSQYPMRGTCGLCQCANILTMAGVPTTEEDMISTALHASNDVLESMELFNADADERGGTTVRDRKELLESQGIEMTNLQVSYDRNHTVRQLASAVASGHGVILSVDVERLWKNGQSGGHAISLLSVTSDESTFIYSDTGRGIIGKISAMDLAKALTGRPANITKNIIR